ncbi:MAG TPA: DUF1801 domain-containing protein [Dehalococcoidia bacterium]|nr:DUF1801 domain-containing protein [Dehalococcoidia bacterium]
MATTDFKSVDEYVSSLPAEVQPVLTDLRQRVKKVAPDSAETISYQLPTFTLNGNRVYVASYKKHVSVYPATDEMEAAFER